jgi:hypothetical protein
VTRTWWEQSGSLPRPSGVVLLSPGPDRETPHLRGFCNPCLNSSSQFGSDTVLCSVEGSASAGGATGTRSCNWRSANAPCAQASSVRPPADALTPVVARLRADEGSSPPRGTRRRSARRARRPSVLASRPRRAGRCGGDVSARDEERERTNIARRRLVSLYWRRRVWSAGSSHWQPRPPTRAPASSLTTREHTVRVGSHSLLVRCESKLAVELAAAIIHASSSRRR